MKLLSLKTVIRTSATAFSFALAIFLYAPAIVLAGSGDAVEQVEASANLFEGTFDGLDLKRRLIWIDDTIYSLDARVKIKGTHKKLGLITDLKQGERIRAIYRENTLNPTKPPNVITFIERL